MKAIKGESVRTCPCCGLTQAVPPAPATMRACCARCETTLLQPIARIRSNSRCAAVAAAGLILYPLAITLPMLRIEQLGHHHEASILDGISTLFSQSQFFVGLIVLACSVIVPVAKLGGLLFICAGGMFLGTRHRAWTYRVIQWTGRWGMLDVLAVAVLVAVVKIGANVELTVGPGAAAFASVVILSLLSSAAFDPHALWEETERPATAGELRDGETK